MDLLGKHNGVVVYLINGRTLKVDFREMFSPIGVS